MMLRVRIELPGNRYQPGALRVLQGARTVAGPWACLGRAANELAALAGNPHRDPIMHDGDTPTGLYGRTMVLPTSGREGLGLRWIPLIPVAGQALDASLKGRTGLGIHAGRGDEKLVPTAGCVRMLDRDFATLAAALGNSSFDVEIVEEKRDG